MFEKEAEEYLIRNLCKTCLTICENNCPHAESEKRAYKDGAEFGYNKANEWHYVTDKLPPNPKESEDGKSILPLNYICAYDCGDGDYECDEFMYLGDGVWNGENKNYPIYAWMDCAVVVPLPPRKENE